MATGGFFAGFGVLLTFVLGTFLPWRHIAWLATFVPIIAFFAIISVWISICFKLSNHFLKILISY